MAARRPPTALMTLTVTFKLGTDPDKAQQLVQNRVAQAEPRLPEEVRQLGVTTDQELARPHDGRAPAVAERPLRHDLSAQLRAAQRQGPARAHRRRRRRAAVRRGRLLDARLARSAEGRRARPDRQRRRQRDPRRRTCRSRPAWSAPRRACTGVDLQLSVNAQGRLQNEEEFGDIIVKTGADGAVTRLRDVARIELGASEYALRSLLDNKPAVAIPIFQAPGSNALADLRRACARPWPS